MKRKFFHRILPVIMAVLMVIGTLPGDLGFSVDAYASAGDAGENPAEQQLTFTVINVDRQKNLQNLKLNIKNSDTILEKVRLTVNSDGNYTGTSVGTYQLGQTYQYSMESDNYDISGKGEFPAANSATTISASGWTYEEHTRIEISAHPSQPNAWGKEVTFTATLSDSDGGKIIGAVLNFDVTEENVTLSTNEGTTDQYGQASVTVSPNNTTPFTVTVMYNGQLGSYAGTLGTLNYTPAKRTATLTLDNPAPTAWNKDVTVTATLKDGDSHSPISDETVILTTSDGKEFKETTKDGQATITIPAGTFTSADETTITANISGSNLYQVTNPPSITYTPKKVAVNLTMSKPDPKAAWGEEVELKATLSDVTVPVSGQTINFKVDGTDVGSGTTNSEGVATCKHTFKNADKVTVSAELAGEAANKYEVTNTDKISVDYTPAKVSPAIEFSVTPATDTSSWQKEVTLTAELTPKNDVAFANNATVTFYVGENPIGDSVIVSGNQAKITWNSATSAGAVNFKAVFNGDSNYEQISADVNNYNFEKATPTLSLNFADENQQILSWKESVELTGQLLDEKEAPLADKTITLKTDSGTLAVGTDAGESANTVTATTGQDGKFTVTLSPEKAGEITVTASYAGDKNFNSSKYDFKYTPLKEDQSFTVVDNEDKEISEVTLSYGDPAKNGQTYILKLRDTDDQDTTLSTNYDVSGFDTNIVGVQVVEDSGKQTVVFKPVNVGTTEVTITQTENDDYEASTQTVTVTVTPYELKLAENDAIKTQGTVKTGGRNESDPSEAWNNEKTYDATNLVDVRAQLHITDHESMGLSEAQLKQLQALLTEGRYLILSDQEAKDAGGNAVTHVADSVKEFNVTFTMPQYTAQDGTAYQNFVFADGNEDNKASMTVTTSITINQRPLTMILSDAFTRQYNKENIQENFVIPSDVIVTVDGYADEEESTVKERINALEAGWEYFTIDNSITIGSAMGEYPKAITIQGDKLAAFNEKVLTLVNQDYIFADSEGGMVTITEEKVADFTQYLSLDTSNSVHAYENDGKIYFGENASAVFTAKAPYNTVYRVLLNEAGEIAGRYKIDADNPLKFTDASTETYLFVLDQITESGTVGETAPFEITFYRDQKMPTANIVIGEVDNAVQEFGKNITFGLYDNKTYDAQITVKDEEGQNLQDYASGVYSVSYKIVNFAKDFDFGADATVINDAVFESLMASEFTALSSEGDITAGENGVYTASVKVPETDPAQIGNYVVFVRVQDNVGNAMIYGSNGMIFENVPITDVTINFDKDTENNRTNYKGGDYFANGEAVNLFITANEEMAANVYSGVEEIIYSVESENKDGITFATTPEDRRFYQAPPEGVTLEQLANEYSSYTGYINNIYTAKDQSQIVTIMASARDFAGNESQSVSRTFTIDPVAPAIENALTSQAQVQNGKYYNQDVVITTTITERFLDMEQKLMYSINGSAYMTLSELVNRQEEFGISGIAIDYGKDGSVGENRSDQSQSTVAITFHEDGVYTISAYVSDYAGNVSSTTQAIEFVVDQTAPVASVTYYSYGQGQTFTPGTSGDAPYYLNQNYSSFKAVVSVSELNFDMNGNVNTNLAIGAKDVDNNTSDAMAAIINTHGTNVKSAQNWSDPSGITRTYTVDVNVDANYSFDFAYTDLAGNKANVIPTGYVTLDRVVPDGEITVSGFVNGADGANTPSQETWFNKFISAITFGWFGRDSVTASMDSSDATSGMASTQYLVSSEMLSKEQLSRQSGWKDYTGNVNLSANMNAVVYERVEDKAGNVEYYSTADMVLDNVDPAPEVTITPSAPAWGKGVYKENDNPGFDISVTDPSVNNAYSGLKEIRFELTNGTTGYTVNGVLAEFSDAGNPEQTWSGTFKILDWLKRNNVSVENFYSNDVQFTVIAVDRSLNESEPVTQTIKYDPHAPVVTFSFSTADALNGKYYKNNKTLTITVDERNFDPSYTPTVTSSSGGGYSFSGWSSNGEIHTGVVTFSGDSDYTVTFDCYDLAGNHSNTENLAEFTVDKTLPAVSVSYNNNDVLNGHYYSDTRTATITITEHNFRASEVRVTTTASLNGSSISAPSAGGWSTSGDRHTATISFPTDGDYTFDIAYTDLAGNAMADYSQDSFTVDLTDPEIEIAGVENRSANKGTVAPVITLTDTNYTANGVSLTLTGANKGRVNVDTMVSRSAVANGQTITFRNFGQGMDDIYTLTARLTDQAGNETTRSITFSVNRDGSTYELDDYVTQLMETGFTNSPQDIVIKETNVDTLEFIEITYSKDGEVVTLEEGKDYTVEEDGGDGQWKVYTYTIKASCFEEEGQYSINIYSEDRAQNTSTNQVKEKSIEFIVDKTAPSVSIANLEDRGRYRENIHEFTLSVKDNMLLSYVELYLDGELVHTYTGDELTVEDGVLTIPVDSKDAYQTVRIVAYDAAGNPTEPVEYQVLVTSNWWIQFYMNKPLFFGCIAGIVVVAGVIIFLVARRSKKDNGKTYKKI